MTKQWSDGYQVSLGIGEVEIRFQNAGEDASVTALSLPVAKSLAASLAQAIATYENRTGQKILLPEEIQRLLKRGTASESNTD